MNLKDEEFLRLLDKARQLGREETTDATVRELCDRLATAEAQCAILRKPADDYVRYMLEGAERLKEVEADAELGRLVRAMPDRCCLHKTEISDEQTRWRAFRLRTPPSIEYSSLPEIALRAAGITPEAKA